MNEKNGKKPEIKPVVKAPETKTTDTKAVEVKPADTKAAAVKPVETKAVEAPKAAAKPVEKASEKPVEKPAAKEPVKAEPEKKETAKKKPGRKPAAKKQEKENAEEVFVEFYGQQSSIEDIKKRVTDAFVAEGHRASTIKSLKLYLKPEDSSAYYVINEKFAGRVDLF